MDAGSALFGTSSLNEIPKHEEDGVEQTRWKKDRGQCRNRSIPLPSLRELRQAQGLSQRKLGKVANVSPGTIYRLEGEQRGAYPLTVRKLAEALRVSPTELVRERRPQ
jgi:DNA-binding XRE family transcriptional regulator